VHSQSTWTQRTFGLALSLLALSCASARPQDDGSQFGQTAGRGPVDDEGGHGPAAVGGGPNECRGPGRYESGKEGSYKPCCEGLQEVSYGKPSYAGDGKLKTCDHPPLRVYACVRGQCGDGICEEGEAAACGCVEDCPQAAWDQADVASQPDAGSNASLDGSTSQPKCVSASSPCSGRTSFCTWAEIAPRIAACVTRLLTPYYAVRCGPYDGVVSQGTDSATYFYYDEAGKLVGQNDVGLSTLGCRWYDPSFTLPGSCEIVTPECSDDAGSGTP
jgi:hypothetical protein